jgi:hypothetical protein
MKGYAELEIRTYTKPTYKKPKKKKCKKIKKAKNEVTNMYKSYKININYELKGKEREKQRKGEENNITNKQNYRTRKKIEIK